VTLETEQALRRARLAAQLAYLLSLSRDIHDLATFLAPRLTDLDVEQDLVRGLVLHHLEEAVRAVVQPA
jgi:hypothetical protein